MYRSEGLGRARGGETYPRSVKTLMTRPHHLSSGKYTNDMVARMTLLAKRLYLTEMMTSVLVSFSQRSASKREGTTLRLNLREARVIVHDICGVGDVRVCEKARGGDAPDSEVPGIEIEFISQLMAIL